MDLTVVDGGDGLVLGIKDAGRAFVDHHLRRDGALLDHAAVRREVALEDGDAAGLAVGPVDRTDDLFVQVFSALQVFFHRFAGAGHHGSVEQVFLRQLLHHRVDAAGQVEVFHKGVPGGGQVAQVRGAGGDGVRFVQTDGDPGLVGDGRQMQHRVGGAAQGHVDRFGVAEGGFGHDVAGADVLFDQLHDLHAGVLGQAQAGGIDRRDRAVARQGHADGLAQAVHGVRGVHAGAGPAGGAGVLFIVEHALFIQRAGFVRADGLEHVAQAGAPSVLQVAGQHRPAGNEDGGDIEPRRGHQQAGHVLVAVGDHDQAVELVGDGHGLGGIRDQVAGDQGIFHADMAHGDAVAHGDGREHDGRAAGRPDAGLDRVGDLVDVHVARDDFVERADHPDQRAGSLFLGIAQGVQKAPVGRAFHADFDGV